MLDRGDQLVPHDPLRRVQMAPWLARDSAVQPDVEHTRQLVLEILFKQSASGLGGALDAVAGVFVHVFGVRSSAFGV
jgi:hypothetical protein